MQRAQQVVGYLILFLVAVELGGYIVLNIITGRF